jgi:release factor glutamine methyltransferase
MAGLDPGVRLFEPGLAATDGADGLTFFRALASEAVRLLEPGGVLMVETGFNQARVVEGIFREGGLDEIRIIMDLAGIERIVRAVRGPSADTGGPGGGEKR